MVLELTHSHPLAGHFGAANTSNASATISTGKVWTLKLNGSARPAPLVRKRPRECLPLILLRIIEVPFERIGMDLEGPLPKSVRGHEYILVIVEYATLYPEAVPLRKSSWAGIPAEILTDQGTPFMSRLMANLCRSLKVKQLRTTIYHPQTDGLVQCFNQTLKQMLRHVVAEDKQDWELMLPNVLFGIRKVPQASTGFTPFELLFGQRRERRGNGSPPVRD